MKRSKHHVGFATGVALVGAGIVGAALPGRAADDAAARGAGVYQQFCVSCHGADMVNPVNSAFDLRMFPADQHDLFINSVMNGKGPMPAWDGTVTPAQAEDLWAYVSAARAKTAGH